MIGNDEHLLDPSFNSSFMDLRSDQKINQPQVVEEVELNRVMESKVIERNVPLQDVFNEPLSSFNSLLLHAPPKTGFPSASLWTCPSKPLRSSPQKREDESNSSVPASPTTFTPSLLPMSHLEKEKEIISNEVDEKISTMTKQEIADAQEALKERFGEGPLASLLERKRQQSQKSSTIPSSQSKTSTDPMSTTPPLSNSKTENLRPPPSHPAHLLNPFSPVHLADQLPYSLSSYFFDIQGYLTTKEKDELAQTLPEILTLTHSRALSQRLLATQLIGHLLYHLKEKEYPGSVRKTLIHAFYDLHVFIHLRTLLDDPSPPVVYAALDAFCKVLPSSLFSFSLLHQPYHQLLLHSSNDPATFTSKDTATISDHAQWIRFNFVQGLLETELMSRLTYLFINNFSTDSRSFSKKSMHKDHSNVALADQEALGGFRYRILKLMYFLCTQSELACAQILKDIPDMLPMLMISSGMDSEPLFQMEKLTYTLLLLRVALQSDVHVYRKLIQPFLLSQQTYLLKLSHHREVCNALTSLFVVITSYGYLPPLDLLSMVFQSSLAVTSTLRFSLLSSILSHELDVLCPSISSWISTARKFLETNFGICVKQIALKTKTMLALTYAFKCVPELPVSFLKAALSTLYEVLKNKNETPMVRHEAAEALGSVANEECIEMLREYAEDSNQVVRESCQVGIDIWEYERSGQLHYANSLEYM
ncbi:hypothetical protein HMI55_006925 [Coelomomyces lativittatus]|nr:hypothetical protein HMI55_006925 [Coelomomyces lativittatus]